MAKRLDVNIKWLSYESAISTNDPKDAEKLDLSVSESALSEVFRRKEAIANGVSDQTIPLPDANTDYLLISCDQEISIKVNGSATAQTCKPKTAGAKTPVFFWRGDITALTISNASGNTANVDIVSANV